MTPAAIEYGGLVGAMPETSETATSETATTEPGTTETATTETDTTEIRERRVPVAGGSLAVAEWGPAHTDRVVLALHGITASSRFWAAVARDLPDARVVAPDLRGRGRSNGLPSPFGFDQHVDDLNHVLEDLALPDGTRLVVAGHATGAFVAVRLAAEHPDAVRALVLVDGGLPLETPPGLGSDADPETLLGPAFRRLTQRFDSREEYRAFWTAHPAVGAHWNDDIAAYVEYDLEEAHDEAGGFRPSAIPEAVAADVARLYGDVTYRKALAALRMPVVVFRAPRGMLDDEPVYAPGYLQQAVPELLPSGKVVEVPQVNHYTIAMTEPGAGVVAEQIRSSLF